MFLVPLYGAQTVIAVLHLPYVPCAPVLCPNCHCCAPSTICSLCPCMVSNLSLLCSIYHMFLVPLVWCPNCHCFAPSTICSLCPCMMSNCHCCAPSTICSLYSCMMSNWQCRAPSTICPLCPCMVPKLSLLCSIYHLFLVPLYDAQPVITVLHLPYVPCVPVWCQTVIAVLHLPSVLRQMCATLFPLAV